MIEGTKSNFNLEEFEYLETTRALSKNFECISKTNAFQMVISDLNLSQNITILAQELSFYYQAFIPEFMELSSNASSTFSQYKFYNAGKLYAQVLQQLVQNLTSFNYYGALRGFYNGFFIMQGLGVPRDSIYCYSQNNSYPIYNFYMQLASAVGSNPNLLQTNQAVSNFLRNVAPGLYSQISTSVLQCILSSEDNQNLKSATGLTLDPMDQDLWNAILRYSQTNAADLSRYLNQFSFYSQIASSPSRNLDSGGIYGSLVYYATS
jgi:hypothetical protein